MTLCLLCKSIQAASAASSSGYFIRRGLAGTALLSLVIAFRLLQRSLFGVGVQGGGGGAGRT